MFVAAANDISVISDSTNAVIATVHLPQIDNYARPWSLAYDPAKGEVFVTNYELNTVSVISDSSGTAALSGSSTTSTSPSGTSTAPTSSTSKPSSASGGGGIPEFPYQLPVAAVFAALVVVSYLLVKRRPFK
jgi:DNA-binding beta-propeller fold protein YncE